jgi:hypothetical protein
MFDHSVSPNDKKKKKRNRIIERKKERRRKKEKRAEANKPFGELIEGLHA